MTNLILTKLKGYSTENIKIMSQISPILQRFDRTEPLRSPQSNDTPEGGIKTRTKGTTMTKKVSYFSQL